MTLKKTLKLTTKYIYRLINELMDVNTTLAQNNSDSE